jgi:multimeric flavodoxin WrbA
MKVLMINGSPNPNGNTAIALNEMKKIFDEESAETEIVTVGNQDIRGCTGCGRCFRIGKCVFDDLVNETAPKFEKADGLVIASPVYFGSANGTLISFLDRLFYSKQFDITMKVGASVASRAAAGQPRPMMNSTNILPWAWPSRRASTGTASTARPRARRYTIQKACSRCGRLPETWFS